MKTKLLKKIRKQYSIFYNPEGHYYGDFHFPEQFVLTDSNNSFNVKFSNNKEDLIDRMLTWIRMDYPDMGKRKRVIKNTVKVWWTQK